MQQVRTPDVRESRLFDWDGDNRSIQIVSGESLLTYRLGTDNQFHFTDRCLKPKQTPTYRKAK